MPSFFSADMDMAVQAVTQTQQTVEMSETLNVSAASIERFDLLTQKLSKVSDWGQPLTQSDLRSHKAAVNWKLRKLNLVAQAEQALVEHKMETIHTDLTSSRQHMVSRIEELHNLLADLESQQFLAFEHTRKYSAKLERWFASVEAKLDRVISTLDSNVE